MKTDAFWDTDAEAVFKKGWRENIDEWNKVGSDYPYHYLGSAEDDAARSAARSARRCSNFAARENLPASKSLRPLAASQWSDRLNYFPLS